MRALFVCSVAEPAPVQAATIYGSSGSNALYGTRGPDRIYGRAGNDAVYGRAGSDALNGGTGKDRLHGQSGDDTILAGTGADAISGGSGNDTVRANDGDGTRDTISCGTGSDSVYARVEDTTDATCELVYQNGFVVERLVSAYATAPAAPAGNFATGQAADMMLSGYGLNRSGGPLAFNHPGQAASDGTRFAMADTRNNRGSSGTLCRVATSRPTWCSASRISSRTTRAGDWTRCRFPWVWPSPARS